MGGPEKYHFNQPGIIRRFAIHILKVVKHCFIPLTYNSVLVVLFIWLFV